MTWLALEAEIAAEMRALSDHQRIETLTAIHHGLAESHACQRFGRVALQKAREARKASARTKAATDARAAALLEAGDIRALRRLESHRRAQKRRRKP